MPDLDILRTSVLPPFRAAYRVIRGREGEEPVLAALRSDLARALKRGGGIPNLHERATLVAAVIAGGPARAATEASKRLLVQESLSRHAVLAHGALERMLVRGLSADARDITQDLASLFCHQLLEHGLFASLRVECRDLGMASIECASYVEHLQREVEPAVSALASQLLEDSSGAAIPTPRGRRRVRPSTADMLQQVVG